MEKQEKQKTILDFWVKDMTQCEDDINWVVVSFTRGAREVAFTQRMPREVARKNLPYESQVSLIVMD